MEHKGREEEGTSWGGVGLVWPALYQSAPPQPDWAVRGTRTRRSGTLNAVRRARGSQLCEK